MQGLFPQREVYSRALFLCLALNYFLFCTDSQAKDTSGYVSVGLSVPNYSLELSRNTSEASPQEFSMTYAPNLPLTSFVGFSLFGLSLKASADIPGTKQQEEGAKEKTEVQSEVQQKVKTEFFSYSAGYFFDRVGIDGSYTQLKGLNLVEVTGLSRVQLNTSEDIYRSDIELKHHTINLWAAPLSFNLSLDDFFEFASKARGSAFGLVLLGSFDAVHQTADSGIIPRQFRSEFGSDQNIKSGYFESRAAQFGPAFVLEKGGFFFEGLITVGQGQQTAVYKFDSNETQTSARSSDKSHFFCAMGYKGQTLFSGFDFTSESPGYYLNSLSIITERSTGRWLVGARF